MKFRREIVLLAAFACVLALSTVISAEQRGSLSAYTINYNSQTEQIEASGNVVLTRGESVVSGDLGKGKMTPREFEVSGNVRGVFPEYNAILVTAELLKWTEARAGGGRIEARGGVRFTRGKSDYLNAAFAMWELETDNYTARGGVNMRFDGHIIRAAEVQRTGSTFYGVNVKRYENIAQKTGMAADRIDGKIRANEIQEMVAVGNVAIDYIDKDGVRTDITGSRAVYNKALDTIVISGAAKAVRGDGNTVSADKMILHIATNRIEAVGKASMSFTADDNKKPKSGASN